MLADIYLGKITNWNDPKIAALNPAEAAEHRDRAGVSRRRLGHDLRVHLVPLGRCARTGSPRSARRPACKWPAGAGAQGNDGVAAAVKNVRGGIGYVENAYRDAEPAHHRRSCNKAGKFVTPTLDAFTGRRRRRTGPAPRTSRST